MANTHPILVAWVTWPERPKDKLKRPTGLPAGSSSILYFEKDLPRPVIDGGQARQMGRRAVCPGEVASR